MVAIEFRVRCIQPLCHLSARSKRLSVEAQYLAAVGARNKGVSGGWARPLGSIMVRVERLERKQNQWIRDLTRSAS